MLSKHLGYLCIFTLCPCSWVATSILLLPQLWRLELCCSRCWGVCRLWWRQGWSSCILLPSVLQYNLLRNSNISRKDVCQTYSINSVGRALTTGLVHNLDVWFLIAFLEFLSHLQENMAEAHNRSISFMLGAASTLCWELLQLDTKINKLNTLSFTAQKNKLKVLAVNLWLCLIISVFFQDPRCLNLSILEIPIKKLCSILLCHCHKI